MKKMGGPSVIAKTTGDDGSSKLLDKLRKDFEEHKALNAQEHEQIWDQLKQKAGKNELDDLEGRIM